MTDYDRTATAIRQANPWAEGAAGAEGEWSTAELLSQIEHRSETVDTIERDTTQPSGPKRNRGWLLAAAVATLVVLIGAIVIGLANRSGTDVVEPTPTTLSAPTTLPTPTTTPPATTVPATTQPPATAAPVVFEPQAYDATMTWDGETCTYVGPRTARAGDTVTMTFTNNSEVLGGFEVGYLTSQASREDLVEYLGPMFDITTYVPPTFALRWHSFTEGTPPSGYGGPLLDRRQLLQPGRSVANEIPMELARTHVFVCHGDTSGPATPPPVPVDVAEGVMTVVEADQPLPELPPQAYDATLTWDGETCTFDGPAEARVRDTLSLTVMNNTDRFGRFVVMYVASGTTIDDVSAYFDDELGNVLTVNTPGWGFPGPDNNLRNTSPPSPFNLVDESGAMVAGEEATLEITIRFPREHVFTCEGADDGSNQADRFIDNAPQTITVTE